MVNEYARRVKQQKVTEKAAGTTAGPKSKLQLGEDKVSTAKQRKVTEKVAGTLTGLKSKSQSGEDKASAAKQREVREKAVGALTNTDLKEDSISFRCCGSASFIKNTTRSRNHLGTRVGIASWNTHLKLNLCWLGMNTHNHTICLPMDKRDEKVSR